MCVEQISNEKQPNGFKIFSLALMLATKEFLSPGKTDKVFLVDECLNKIFGEEFSPRDFFVAFEVKRRIMKLYEELNNSK